MKISAAVAGLLASGALAHVGLSHEEGKNMMPAAQPMDTVKRGGIKTDGDNINVSGDVDADLGHFHHKRDGIDPVKVGAGADVDADADVKAGVKRNGLRCANRRSRKAKAGVSRWEMPVPGSQSNGQGRNRMNDMDTESESDCSGSDTDCGRRGRGRGRGRGHLRRREQKAKAQKSVEDGHESSCTDSEYCTDY